MQFVVEQRGFECLSLEVYKKKKLISKGGDETVVEFESRSQ